MTSYKLNIGCGQRIEPGWHNIDLFDEASGARPPQSDGVISHDVRKGLPYADNSVDMIFSEHFIEHLTRDEGEAFFKECFRVMKPGAAMRVSTPNLERLTYLYSTRWAGGFQKPEWETAFASVGYNPQTACQMMNEGMREWGHKFIYDCDELATSLIRAGLYDIEQYPTVTHGKTDIADMLTEGRPYTGDLIVEVIK